MTTKPPTSGERRSVILDRAAVDAARAWTAAYCGELAAEGRAVEGGWPGTMREARTRATVEASRALAGTTMSPLTHEEIERLAQTANEEARRLWMRSANMKRRR